jgi:hypothetical protein
MARQKSIQTASGILLVRQGINAHSQVTGRVAGVTYAGATWAEVEAKIQEAYAVQYEWSRWLVFRVDFDRFDNFEPAYDVDVVFRWSEVQVSQCILRPRFDLPRLKVEGFMVLDDHCNDNGLGGRVPRFKEGATVRQALGTPCLPWTESREAFARDVVDRLRATAAGIQAFLANENLARAIDAAPTARALTGEVDR